jgi:hypothetical protein
MFSLSFLKMGLFEKNVENIVVRQAVPGGQAATNLKVEIPYWEIVISFILVIVLLVVKNILSSYFNNKIIRQAKTVLVNETV